MKTHTFLRTCRCVTGAVLLLLTVVSSASAQERIQVATFNLTPQGAIAENVEQARTAALAVVDVVKTVLYSQGGVTAANASGRKLWFDSNTLQLTITDYPSNIAVVSDYIRSVQGTGARKQKSEIIFLKHQNASELQSNLDRVRGASSSASSGGAGNAGGQSVVRSLRTEGELTFRDLRIRVTKVNQNDEKNDNDDSVELVVRTATNSEDRTIQEYHTDFIEDYEISVNEVRPSGKNGEGSARLEIRYRPQTTGQLGANGVRR